MMRYFISGCILLLILVVGCKKSEIVQPPSEPEGTQHEIPWPTVADAPWPMFQADPQCTGRSRFRGPQQGKIAWTSQYKGSAEYPYVTVDRGGMIRFATGAMLDDSGRTTSAYVFSVDAAGSLKWKTDIFNPRMSGRAPTVSSSLTIDASGTIYAGSSNGYFYAINSDGTVKWKFKAGGGILSGYRGANIGLDGTIYFSSDKALFAMNPDGSVKWQLPTYPRSGVTFSPDGKTLYVPTSYSVDALDEAGTRKWSFPFSVALGMVSPLVDSQGNVYFVGGDTTFTSLGPEGKLRWQYHTVSHIDETTAPIMDPYGNVYFTTFEGLYSLDYSGQLRWKINVLRLGPQLVCDNEGMIYAGRYDGFMFAITSSGRFKWFLDPRPVLDYYHEENRGCPALGSDGRLYVLVRMSEIGSVALLAVE